MSEIDWGKAPEDAQAYMPKSYEWLEGWWKKKGDQCYFWSISMPNDGGWQSTYAEPFGHKDLMMRPSPAWSGEGLPPVGTVCEALYMGQPQGVVRVRYSGQCMILWSEDRSSEQCGQADHYLFKPIRTPEQIAADEREAAIKEMTANYAKNSDTLAGWAAYVYDTLGYRKP